jgi:hypothetical protein
MHPPATDKRLKSSPHAASTVTLALKSLLQEFSAIDADAGTPAHAFA